MQLLEELVTSFLLLKHTLLPIDLVGLGLLNLKFDLALAMVSNILHHIIVALNQFASFNLVALCLVDYLANLLNGEVFIELFLFVLGLA